MTKTGWKMLGVECPECGGLQTGVMKAGLDSEGHRIRHRVCRNCEHGFTTLEIPFPFVFNQLDEIKPDNELARLRRDGPQTRFTAVPRTNHAYFTVTYSEGDQRKGRIAKPSAHVVLHPAAKNDQCRRGLHMLRGHNVISRADGKRRCRECSNAKARTWRREFRQRFPHLAREQDAIKRDRERARKAARAAEAKAA